MKEVLVTGIVSGGQAKLFVERNLVSVEHPFPPTGKGLNPEEYGVFAGCVFGLMRVGESRVDEAMLRLRDYCDVSVS